MIVALNQRGRRRVYCHDRSKSKRQEEVATTVVSIGHYHCPGNKMEEGIFTIVLVTPPRVNRRHYQCPQN